MNELRHGPGPNSLSEEILLDNHSDCTPPRSERKRHRPLNMKDVTTKRDDPLAGFLLCVFRSSDRLTPTCTRASQKARRRPKKYDRIFGLPSQAPPNCRVPALIPPNPIHIHPFAPSRWCKDFPGCPEGCREGGSYAFWGRPVVSKGGELEIEPSVRACPD